MSTHIMQESFFHGAQVLAAFRPADTTIALVMRPGGQKMLVVSGDHSAYAGQVVAGGRILLGDLTPDNARAVRQDVPWLRPAALGLRQSFGMGDPLGMATPGHAWAAEGQGIAPVFAQHTPGRSFGSTPQQTLDNATWGAFESSWRGDWGADADGLRSVDDLRPFVQAGYTGFTVDAGAWLNMPADDEDADLAGRWQGSLHLPDGRTLDFGGDMAARLIRQYSAVVAQTTRIWRALREHFGGSPFDFEVSLAGAPAPTDAHAHYFIASELARRGVVFTALAPRLPDAFEEGIDAVGDADELADVFAAHAAVQAHFGHGYKLSLHDASDKFSLYPLVKAAFGERLHLKTSGTSSLLGLDVLARHDPALFRELYAALAHAAPLPDIGRLRDGELPDHLALPAVRLALLRGLPGLSPSALEAMRRGLALHHAAYELDLVAHFRKHLKLLRPR
jgi:tagaturonate epimerase